MKTLQLLPTMHDEAVHSYINTGNDADAGIVVVADAEANADANDVDNAADDSDGSLTPKPETTNTDANFFSLSRGHISKTRIL